jgi:hypothetical protein
MPWTHSHGTCRQCKDVESSPSIHHTAVTNLYREIRAREPDPTRQQPSELECWGHIQINRSLSKWLLGCVTSPYIHTSLLFVCSSSLLNSINPQFTVLLNTAHRSLSRPGGTDSSNPMISYPLCFLWTSVIFDYRFLQHWFFPI